jgi:hypothetical protein
VFLPLQVLGKAEAGRCHRTTSSSTTLAGCLIAPPRLLLLLGNDGLGGRQVLCEWMEFQTESTLQRTGPNHCITHYAAFPIRT